MTDGRVARGRRTRQAILDACIEVIRSDGTAAITHRVVAARAEVSLASTTYHFDSLDDLLVAAFEQMTDHAVAQLRAMADEVLLGKRDLLDAAIEFVETRNPRYGFSADVLPELSHASIRNERLRKPLEHLIEQMSGPFAELIGEADAAILVRALNGALIHRLAQGDSVPPGDLRTDLTRMFQLFGLTEAVSTRLERAQT